MKINVKTLKGTHFEIEVNPQDTVMLYNTPNYYYWNKTIFLGFFYCVVILSLLDWRSLLMVLHLCKMQLNIWIYIFFNEKLMVFCFCVFLCGLWFVLILGW